MNSATPTLKRIILWGGILILGIAIIGGVVGAIVDPQRGLVSALVGALVAFGFVALTAVSVLLGIKLSKGDMLNPAFFAIVLGGWLFKFIAFFVAIIVLRDQPWVNTVILFLTVVVGVLGSLVVDVVAVAKSRLPYVSDVVLPGSESTPERIEP